MHKKILLDKEDEMDYSRSASMFTGFLCLNRSNIARRPILKTVDVFADRNDQRWLAGFLASKI
jgi:hypothetical protein